LEEIMLRQLLIGAAFVAFGAASVNAQYQEIILRKVEVAGSNFDIVFAMASPQAATTRRDHHDPMAVYSIGGELAHAIDGEIEKMFNDVGPSGLPIHAFRLELNDGNPSIALNVYVVPKLPLR
jgi:hypothetical protein